LDKSVFRIGDGLFAVFSQHLLQAYGFTVACGQDVDAVGQCLDEVFDLFVVLQQFDGQESGGVFVADSLVAADFAFHLFDASLHFVSVVDVYVVVESARMFVFHAACVKRVVGHILPVPVAQVVQCFGAQVALFVEEVASFVDADDGVEELVNAFSRARYGGDDGRTEQFT